MIITCYNVSVLSVMEYHLFCVQDLDELQAYVLLRRWQTGRQEAVMSQVCMMSNNLEPLFSHMMSSRLLLHTLGQTLFCIFESFIPCILLQATHSDG